MVSLRKGENVSLNKLAADAGASLGRVVVACGWDVNAEKKGLLRRGHDYDLDVSAAGLDASGMVPQVMDPTDRHYQEWFIFANHRHPSSKSVQFMGDNRTGKGDGDDELMKFDLLAVPDSIERILCGVVIWRAAERQQTFAKVENAFIRLFDEVTGTEFARYSLTDKFADETFMVFGELYRRSGEWKFRAIGQGYDPASYRREYGIKHAFETDYARYDD